jgi:hypothetical protein
MNRSTAKAGNGRVKAAGGADNSGLTSFHCLHGIFNLEDVPIGTEWGLEINSGAGVLFKGIIPEYCDGLASHSSAQGQEQRELAVGS